MPSEGGAKIGATITAKDKEATETNGQSGLNILQYAWSKSSTKEPEEWEDFTNGQKIEKAGIEEAETWYLWTKVEDKAGNRNEEIKTSEGFTITGKEDPVNQITITPSIEAEKWTHGDVTVKVDIGENLKGENKITVSGEEGKDYEIDEDGNIIIKTNGTQITVEGEDEAGNKITETLTIENIDKEAPELKL